MSIPEVFAKVQRWCSENTNFDVLEQDDTFVLEDVKPSDLRTYLADRIRDEAHTYPCRMRKIEVCTCGAGKAEEIVRGER